MVKGSEISGFLNSPKPKASVGSICRVYRTRMRTWTIASCHEPIIATQGSQSVVSAEIPAKQLSERGGLLLCPFARTVPLRAKRPPCVSEHQSPTNGGHRPVLGTHDSIHVPMTPKCSRLAHNRCFDESGEFKIRQATCKIPLRGVKD